MMAVCSCPPSGRGARGTLEIHDRAIVDLRRRDPGSIVKRKASVKPLS